MSDQSNPFADFNDNLDAPGPTGKAMPSVAQAKAGEKYVEQCPKCRGSGRFISYGGRNLGPCFACKGAGKNSYKSSPEDRAKSRNRAAANRISKSQQIEADAKAWLAANPDEGIWLVDAAQRNILRGGSFTFPQDILNKLWQYGSVTDAQLAAVHRLMARDDERAAQRAAAAPAVDASKIEQAFAVARERAKRPGQDGTFVRPLKLFANDVTVHFTPGSLGSQWENMLFAKDADGKKLGHIKGGKFFKKFDCSEVEAAAVQACAADPQAAVLAYAKAWRACGICSRTLLNDVSIERGIGPICAEKYGWSF